MTNQGPRTLRRLAWGAVWGLTVLALSVSLAGAGHGTFVLLGFFSAPISLLGSKAAWISCIFVGIALAFSAPRKEFPFVAAIHYMSGLAVISVTEFADWQRLSVLPFEYAIVLFIGVAVYAVGNVLLWRVWLAAQRNRETSTI